MRFFFSVIAVTVFTLGIVSGQSLVRGNLAKPPPDPAVEEIKASEWSFSASAFAYSIPDDKDYLSPLLTADLGWLHMEARHNYEALHTASLWLGCNFSFGEKLVFDFTPMIGGVFGHTKGLAPGWRMALSHGAFELTSEAEFVFDAKNSDDNFFYMWSELTWSPIDWLWIGLAGQRSRIFQSELDIQRGFLIGVTIRKVDFTAYVFNWGWTDPAFVLSVGMKF